MAIGDPPDMLARLKALLPPWFPDVAPILTGLLSGVAGLLSFIWSLIGYAKLQTRIKTATDGWLDIIAFDFFGVRVQRKAKQTDGSFRNTIIVELFRERATRAGLSKVLFDLTGNIPAIFEPARPADTGGYNFGGVGYNAGGGYGSLLLPNQIFVVPFRPALSGIPNSIGYGAATAALGSFLGGYGVGGVQYGSLDMIQGAVTDPEIYAAIDSVMPAGEIAWTSIQSFTSLDDGALWFFSFYGPGDTFTLAGVVHQAVHVTAPVDLGA